MHKTTLRLLILQVIIGGIIFLITFLTPYKNYNLSILSGVSVSVVSIMIAWLIFRRMPKILRSRTFYVTMLAYEGVKWLAVLMLTIVFLKMNLEPLGILVGFFITYLGSYFLMLLMK